MIDVQHWLAAGGIVLLAAIVFAESGLLFGFFLPGDSLLFIAGSSPQLRADGFSRPWRSPRASCSRPLPAATRSATSLAGASGRNSSTGPKQAVQPRQRDPNQDVLRAARTKGRCPGTLRAGRSHLHPFGRRRGEHALPHLHRLQPARRSGVGHRA